MVVWELLVIIFQIGFDEADMEDLVNVIGIWEIKFKGIFLLVCFDGEGSNPFGDELAAVCQSEIKVPGAQHDLISDLECMVPAVFVSLGLLTGLCFDNIVPGFVDHLSHEFDKVSCCRCIGFQIQINR